jgi:hypothetical protein
MFSPERVSNSGRLTVVFKENENRGKPKEVSIEPSYETV